VKSDSRYQSGLPVKGSRFLCLRELSCLTRCPSTQSRAADMTGLLARRARQSRGDGSDVVTSRGSHPSARALLSFQGPLRPCMEGLSEQARSASRATTQYIGEIVLDPVFEHSRCPGGPGSVAPVSRNQVDQPQAAGGGDRAGALGPAADHPSEAPLAHLQHLAVEIPDGHVEPAPVQHLPAHLHAALPQ
jgi:hypothetical protein